MANNTIADIQFDLNKIKEILPHRYPFLLIDRVIDVVPGKSETSSEGASIKAIKNVTVNEEFFNGHFPENPIMPGVLILEAMAQAGALANTKPKDPPMEFMIASVSSAKFRKPVVPGDQLIITARVEKDKGRMRKIVCKAEVENQVVASAEVLAIAQPRDTNL